MFSAPYTEGLGHVKRQKLRKVWMGGGWGGRPVRESTEKVAKKRKYEGKFVFKHPPDFEYASISYSATLPNWTSRKAVLLLP